MSESKPSILLMEDDAHLAVFFQSELETEDYQVDVCADGRQGLRKVESGDFQLIILEQILPGLSGQEIIRRIRDSGNVVPIIVLSERDSILDRISLLNQGADACLAKPVQSEYLLALVRTILRRVEADLGMTLKRQNTLRFRDLALEKDNHLVHRGQEIIELTKREFELLTVLMENINIVLSREDLLCQVWGYSSLVETNVVDVYIRYLRSKLDRKGQPSYIDTVRGTGYVMRSEQ